MKLKLIKLKVITLACCILTLGGQALAVPALQLYMPGSDYDSDSESWYSYGDPYNLSVVGASQGNIDRIESLHLYFGISEEWWTMLGEEGEKSITLTGPYHESGTTKNRSDFQKGTPNLPGDGVMPRHGVYPAYWTSFALPDMKMEGPELVEVENYSPEDDDGTDTGKIYNYTVVCEGIYGAWMDAAGLAFEGGKETTVFAPYSHNALALTPEPNTFILGLLATVIGGVVALRSKRRLRSSSHLSWHKKNYKG